MTAHLLKQGTGGEIRKLFTQLAASLGETLASLVGRQVVVRPAEPELEDAEAVAADLPRTCVVARGILDKGVGGRTFFTLVEVADAVAMAGLLMMTPEDVVAQRRAKGTLEAEDASAFGELGNVLCSAFANVLQAHLGSAELRYQDHAILKPGGDNDRALGTGSLCVCRFRMKVGEYPESTGAIAVDRATAEAWNKAPLEAAAAEATAQAQEPGGSAPVRGDDDGLEGIPAAPVRGTLAAFVLRADALRTVRRSCRRVGLELRRHGRGEIPNPAAHKNEIVLLDVPPGEERRFGWCRRIKEMVDSAKVVVLIHHPSRQRVAQAFLSQADVILGFPCDEQQLAQKLASLLPGGAEPPPAT